MAAAEASSATGFVFASQDLLGRILLSCHPPGKALMTLCTCKRLSCCVSASTAERLRRTKADEDWNSGAYGGLKKTLPTVVILETARSTVDPRKLPYFVTCAAASATAVCTGSSGNGAHMVRCYNHQGELQQSFAFSARVLECYDDASGRSLVAAGAGDYFWLWNRANCSQSQIHFPVETRRFKESSNICFMKNGATLAVGSSRGLFSLDVESSSELHQVSQTAVGNRISTDLASSRLLVAMSADNDKIHCVDMRCQQTTASINTGGCSVGLGYDSSINTIVAATKKQIFQWDSRRLEAPVTVAMVENQFDRSIGSRNITSLHLASDGRLVTTSFNMLSASNSRVHLWNVRRLDLSAPITELKVPKNKSVMLAIVVGRDNVLSMNRSTAIFTWRPKLNLCS